MNIPVTELLTSIATHNAFDIYENDEAKYIGEQFRLEIDGEEIYKFEVVSGLEEDGIIEFTKCEDNNTYQLSVDDLVSAKLYRLESLL